MLTIFLVNLLVTLVATFISFNTSEEIIQISTIIIAIICLFFTIVFSPITIKFIAIGLLLLSQWFTPRLATQSRH